MLDLTFRPMTETDRNYVLSTWLRSYAETYEARLFFDGPTRGQFFDVYQPVVKGLLDRGTVTVACLPENEDVVVGWICTEGETVLYLVVKPKFRGVGVAGKLLAGMEALPLSYSNITPPAKKRLRFPSNWRYTPGKRFA